MKTTIFALALAALFLLAPDPAGACNPAVVQVVPSAQFFVAPGFSQTTFIGRRTFIQSNGIGNTTLIRGPLGRARFFQQGGLGGNQTLIRGPLGRVRFFQQGGVGNQTLIRGPLGGVRFFQQGGGARGNVLILR